MTEDNTKVALITGITGQDGSYLAEFLLSKSYKVHGIIRRASNFNTSRIDHIYPKLHLHFADITDSSSLLKIIAKIQPSEVYNLAAQSHVRVSFDMPEYTAETSGLGCARLLDAICTAGLEKKCRYYQASTSELYGGFTIPQNELTPFYPRSPYAVAKLFAYWTVKNYREAFDMFAVNGILFNHESPRRGPTFVTRKVCKAVAQIARGKQECLVMGNLDSRRDWGHAREYVVAMWMMLQAKIPEDYVVATGTTTTVRTWVELAFQRAKLPIFWEGKGVDEVGKLVCSPNKVVVKIDSKYYRPTEVNQLLGDPTKIREQLGWNSQITVQQLVNEMVDAELLSIA